MSVPDFTDERFQQVRAHLDALQKRAWSHATTVRIAHLLDDIEVGYNTASGVLIEFPSRTLVATAWHVVEEFQRLRSEGSEVALVLDSMPIVRPRSPFFDTEWDIAFIEVPNDNRALIRAVPYRPQRLWPPPRVVADDQVFVCGFPKILRKDGDEILHGDFNLLVGVCSAGERHFMLQVDYGNLTDAGRVALPKEHVDYGGVSGGPVFLADSEGSPLVGLVSQAGSSLPLWRIASLADVPSDLDRRPSVAV